MSRPPVKAVQVINEQEVYNSRAPGVYWFDDERHLIIFKCPCGCETDRAIPLDGSSYGNNHSWQWNGDKDCPSITPSIALLSDCRWHGFLTNGEWTFV